MDLKINKQQCISLVMSVAIFGVSLKLFGIGITCIAISSIIAIFFSIQTAIKLSSIFNPHSDIKYVNRQDYKPLVSIHVACKNEPASIVNKSIKALSELDYPNFEVIVINNNSTNEENWTKIKNYVEKLGSNFKFVHVDKVEGFKAGALNYLNTYHFNKKAIVNAIVDCDYIVRPDFLNKTVGYFKNPKIGIVQAPQSYNGVDENNIGLSFEYRSFFALVMNQAQRLGLVTFTGTMGMIRSSLLKKGLKWSEWCITEDVEAGVSINNIGYQGVYVDESLGKGLMPFNYSSLIKQRQRWTYGNMQIIKKDLFSVLKNRILSLKQKIAFLSLLVTWFHFELLIASAYAIMSVLKIFIYQKTDVINCSNFMLLLLTISTVSNFIYFMIGLRKEASPANRIKAFLAHYGLIYVMSCSWMACLFGKKLGFKVTKKSKTNKATSLYKYWKEFIIIIILAIGFIINAFTKNNVRLDAMVVILYSAVEILGILYLYNLFQRQND